MPNSKHIIHTSAMLMNWLYGQHISTLYIAYTHDTDAYVKYDIMHYIMALAYLQDTRSVVQLEVLLDQRDTEFSKTINRNLVVNDITYRLGTYAYADGLVLMGVGQLVKDIQKLRMSIIK
jgi:hypothetical protein